MAGIDVYEHETRLSAQAVRSGEMNRGRAGQKGNPLNKRWEVGALRSSAGQQLTY
jgi:hypothetical protein